MKNPGILPSRVICLLLVMVLTVVSEGSGGGERLGRNQPKAIINILQAVPMGAAAQNTQEIVKKEAVLKPASPPLRVFVDVGHGGRDDGAVNHGIQEKVLCAKISYLVRRELKQLARRRRMPIEVRLSRLHDVYLKLRERAAMANAWGADLFVSIHANASTSSIPSGFEVYFLSTEATDPQAARLALIENREVEREMAPIKSDVLSILTDAKRTFHISESSQFAEVMYETMARRLRPNKRGVRQGPFTVLHGTAMPAVLVEVGYLSNRSDAQKLKSLSYLKRVAYAISTGIMAFAKRYKKGLS